MENYDTWKLDNNEPDQDLCERCENASLDIEEFSYRDCDGGIQTLFCCISCIESQFWV